MRTASTERLLLPALCLLGLALSVFAGHAKSPAASFQGKPDAWFTSEEGRRVTTNILSHQSDAGGWPKNTDTTTQPFAGDRKELRATFDNGATTDELRFLARAFNATKDERCRVSFERGFDHILQAQYPTGGWPQFYPPDQGYHRHITFNDDSMVRLMEFLRETWTDDRYAFVPGARKQAAREAFARGVQCILKCQIKVDGRLTGWCAQHDELDFRPRPGRAYELVSLSGSESVGIARLLMSLDQPGPEVIQAVEGAVAWFQAAALKGIKVIIVPDAKSPKGTDKRVVADAAAPLLWARFHEIGSNRPIYCDRDGVKKHRLEEIGYERRNGYGWLGDWPRTLLEREYPAWRKRLGLGSK
jgi:pectate lyase